MMTAILAFTFLLIAVVAYALLTAYYDDGRSDD